MLLWLSSHPGVSQEACLLTSAFLPGRSSGSILCQPSSPCISSTWCEWEVAGKWSDATAGAMATFQPHQRLVSTKAQDGWRSTARLSSKEDLTQKWQDFVIGELVSFQPYQTLQLGNGNSRADREGCSSPPSGKPSVWQATQRCFRGHSSMGADGCCLYQSAHVCH